MKTHLTSIALSLLITVIAAVNGRCYLKDLQKAENISPLTPNITLSGDRLNVTCDEGYTTGPVIPICIDGKWNRNDISPCKEMTCNKLPPKIINAVEEVIYSRVRTIVKYRCKEPYIIEGPSQIECLFGEWTGQLPKCTSKDCADPPPNVIHSDVEIIATPQNILAKYVCKEPYFLVGNSEIRCLFGGWNDTAPTCKDSRCYLNDLQTADNLAEETPIATNSGQKLNATCKAGYTPDEERPLCQNGTWIKNPISICKESTCSIPNVDHGDILEEYKGEFYFNLTKLPYDRNVLHIKIPLGRIVSPGTSYMLLCHKGHVVRGKPAHESDISCIAGKWLPEPVCVFEIKCRKLKETDLLRIHYTEDRKIGSFASFHCTAPGKRLGEPFAKCLRNGLWSKSVPKCQPPKCSIYNLFESLPQRVFPDLRNVTDNYVPYGSELQLVCEPNSFLSGSSKTKCGSQGKWEHGTVRCIQGCTLGEITPTSQLLVKTIKDYYLFGEAIIFSCPPGQKLSSEIQRVMCLGTSWSDPIPDCVAAPQANPSNRSIQGCTLGEITPTSKLLVEPVKEYYLFSEAITFSCPPGQKLSSEIQRVMCLGTSWSDPIPDCVVAPQANPSNSRKSKK